MRDTVAWSRAGWGIVCNGAGSNEQMNIFVQGSDLEYQHGSSMFGTKFIVTLVSTGSNCYLWVNGVYIDTVATGIDSTNTDPVTLGSLDGAGNDSNTEFYDFLVHHRALSGDEVIKLHSDFYQIVKEVAAPKVQLTRIDRGSFIPDRRVEMPQLFKPGYMPDPMTVDINWENTLSRGLIGLWIPTVDGVINVVDHKRTVDQGMTYSPVDGKRAATADADDDHIDTEIKTTAVETSIIMNCRIDSFEETINSPYFGAVGNGAVGPICANQASDNEDLWFVVDFDSSPQSMAPTTFDIPPFTKTIGCMFTNGSQSFFENTRRVLSVESLQTLRESANTLHFFDRGDHNASLRHTKGSFFWGMLFDRKITDIEYLAIYKNPNQLLTPK